MAEVSYPFDGGAGAFITEQQWSNMAATWQDNGVIASGPESMSLKVTTLNQVGIVYLEAGEANLLGFHYENTGQLPLPVPPNNTSLTRIDLVALQLDKNTNAVRTVYKTGAAASSPVPPNLVTTGGVYEIALAQIQMGPNATQVPNTQPQLVDQRSFLGKRILVAEDPDIIPEGTIGYRPSDNSFYGGTGLNGEKIGWSNHVHSDYSPFNHNHNSAYSLLGHTHSSTTGEGVRVRRTTAVSGSAGVANPISWQSTVDANGTAAMWSPITNPTRVTVQSSGVYIVTAHIEWAGSVSSGYRTGLIRHSTGGVLAEDNKPAIGLENVRCNPVVVYYASSGTYFTFEGWQGTSAAININVAQGSVTKIG